MAGYTSRILLTFGIPFFGFVLWFLKKQKSKSISSTGEDFASADLLERQVLQFDSSITRSRENSCEDKSTMQLKETQTPESQDTNAVQQNGVSQECTQHNGVQQDSIEQQGNAQDVHLKGISQLNHNGVSKDHNGVSKDHSSASKDHSSVSDDHSSVLNDHNGVSKDHSSVSNDHNGVSKDHSSVSKDHNGISKDHNCTTIDDMQPHNISQDAMQNGISENDLQPSNISSNYAQQNGVSQKSTLSIKHNGTTSKSKKKNKSKVREKSRTRSSDINSNERLHLEDEAELVKRIEVVDLKNNSVSSKDDILNAINKNEMNQTNGADCNSQSNVVCINGDANPEADQSIVLKEESAKKFEVKCDVLIERDTNETTQSLTNEIKTDQNESLMLPVDCKENNCAVMENNANSCCDSLGSNDSVRGASEEIHFEAAQNQDCNQVLNYAFEIPQKYVGLLIGRQGKNVNMIKEKTNADILIKRHPTNNQNKICLITGTEDEINAALRRIRDKFPPERFPNVTLSQICFLPFMPCPENLMLRLPEGSPFDVMLSATVTAGHFFLQQPTHPSFHSLVSLTYQMTEMYNHDLAAPSLPHMERGFICAANLSNCWYRAEIDDVFYETDECRVRFLDYGGYSILPRSALRQINYQFMNVPFQATECYLGLVTLPEGQTDWSPEATACFEELAQGQILQGFIIAYAENGVPYVQLYRITGVEHVDINMALVQRGHARYIKPQPVV